MTEADGETLEWDLNGNMTTGINPDITWNWDNQLQSAQVANDSIKCLYTPTGEIIYKESTVSSTTTKRKYIIDTIGAYPVILMEMDPDDNNTIKKSYVYAMGQVLMQHDGNVEANKYFYLHDRLGSVRLIGSVKNLSHFYL